MVKNKDDRWYWRLTCGHIRMVKGTLVKTIPGETQVYCIRCDDHMTLVEKCSRYDQ